jgi:hypothetical protein
MKAMKPTTALLATALLAGCGGGGYGPGITTLPNGEVNGDLQGRQIFLNDSPWNTPIDTAPVDPNSDAIIANIGANDEFHPDFGANWNGGPFGIPYVVVDGNQPPVNVTFGYDDESDPGPYPVPPNAPVEPGGDRHVLVATRTTGSSTKCSTRTRSATTGKREAARSGT